LLIAKHSCFSGKSSEDIDMILARGVAPASGHLLALIEFLFRTRSRYLNEDGRLIRIIPGQLQKKLELQKNKIGYRVNQVQQAFHLFVYRNTEEPASMFRDLQRRIKIDERLKLIRNPTMHGTLADPASEGPFYALVVALFYFTERK
jgi:hypothetical protein